MRQQMGQSRRGRAPEALGGGAPEIGRASNRQQRERRVTFVRGGYSVSNTVFCGAYLLAKNVTMAAPRLAGSAASNFAISLSRFPHEYALFTCQNIENTTLRSTPNPETQIERTPTTTKRLQGEHETGPWKNWCLISDRYETAHGSSFILLFVRCGVCRARRVLGPYLARLSKPNASSGVTKTRTKG